MKFVLRALIALFCLIDVASAADYYPLVVGNVWNYILEDGEWTGTVKMAVEQKFVNGTDTVFRVSSKIEALGFRDSAIGYMMSNANDVVTFESLNDAKPYEKDFEHQPVTGHTWNYSTGEVVEIVYYGSITVAAGTFNSCYAVTVDGDTAQIYAPDVGMVAAISDGIAITLTSYTVSTPNSIFIQRQQASGNVSAPPMMGPGIYTLVNTLGRRIDAIASGRSGGLSPGDYFLFSREARAFGTKGARKICVTGQ